MLHLEREGNAAFMAMLRVCEMSVIGFHQYEALFISLPLDLKWVCLTKRKYGIQWSSAGYLVNKAMETEKQ